jgi:hypothetical protein
LRLCGQRIEHLRAGIVNLLFIGHQVAEQHPPVGATLIALYSQLPGEAFNLQPVGFCLVCMSGFCRVTRLKRRPKTLREKVEARIARKRDAVFLTREFTDLGGEDQVLRVLRGLVQDGRLVRLGYGVYGRAIVSRLSGQPILYGPNGFAGAARQALTKLGVTWEPGAAERAYNEGRSTQVPVNPVVRVKGRFSRKLRYGNTELVLEK